MQAGVLLQYQSDKNTNAKRIDTYNREATKWTSNDDHLDCCLVGLTNDVHCAFNGTMSKKKTTIIWRKEWERKRNLLWKPPQDSSLPRQGTRNVKHGIDAFQGLPEVSCRDIVGLGGLKTGLDEELYLLPRAVLAIRMIWDYNMGR